MSSLHPAHKPVTLKSIARAVAAGERFACLTCYDASMARLLQRAGVPLLLVGDTAAEVVLGFDRTIHMPLELQIALTAGVKRGAPRCVVMGDMPFMSYQASADDAMRHAGRFMTEGQADIVKVEADATLAPLVDRMTRAGIPVCGHVGSRPQRAAITSGYTSAGKTQVEADSIVQDAVALEQAGAMMLLVEAVPDHVTQAILVSTRVPLIGIGAGAMCHGQVLVLQDVLGLSEQPPAFARPALSVREPIEHAVRAWIEMVEAGRAGGRAEGTALANGRSPEPHAPPPKPARSR